MKVSKLRKRIKELEKLNNPTYFQHQIDKLKEQLRYAEEESQHQSFEEDVQEEPQPKKEVRFKRKPRQEKGLLENG